MGFERAEAFIIPSGVRNDEGWWIVCAPQPMMPGLSCFPFNED
jgi:hypothetical protein